jgi:flavodoxin
LSKNEDREAGSRRAIVIFDSRYGNTEKVARSFEEGLKQAGITTLCINAKEVSLELLKEYGLIAVGAPTEKITASESIKKFLVKLGRTDLSGKLGFAFDTKLSYPLTGSAAKFIEKKLRNMGLDIAFERASAIVVPLKREEDVGKEFSEEYFSLKDGEEKRFEEIGKRVGRDFLRINVKEVPAR